VIQSSYLQEREMAAEFKIKQSLIEFEEKKKRMEEEKLKKQDLANKYAFLLFVFVFVFVLVNFLQVFSKA
jgi:hypothetical protein